MAALWIRQARLCQGRTGQRNQAPDPQRNSFTHSHYHSVGRLSGAQHHASNLMLQSPTMCGLVCTSRPHTSEKSSGVRSSRHRTSRPFPMWSCNSPAWRGLNQPCSASVRLRAPPAKRADSAFASFPTVHATSWREKCKCAISFSKLKLDAAGGTSSRAYRTAPEWNVASDSRPTRTACNASQSSKTATTN
jgi:hypothetical protein